jgi:hypothetical protein
LLDLRGSNKVSALMTGRFKGLTDGPSKPQNLGNVAFCVIEAFGRAIGQRGRLFGAGRIKILVHSG